MVHLSLITNTGEADLAWLGMEEMIINLVLNILRLIYIWDIVKMSLSSRVQKSSFGKWAGLEMKLLESSVHRW